MDNPLIRAQFERNNVISSEWYRERLRCKQKADSMRLKKSILTLENFLSDRSREAIAQKLDLVKALERTKTESLYVESAAYLQSLTGTIGADPLAVVGKSEKIQNAR